MFYFWPAHGEKTKQNKTKIAYDLKMRLKKKKKKWTQRIVNKQDKQGCGFEE